MKYLSVCSGIEAATVAWHSLGWQPVGFSEIEPFPSAVLAHHYPSVPNLGDMTNYKEWNIGAIDLLVGGTPCQSFSVAGLRKGLEDPRGNLALVYCGILDHFRPQWCVWENVPGVLSSNGGRDFGSFLGALAELGYGFAYRVLDAQYFGVAQRRRRVFVVGYLGDWHPAAAVLFERQSLRRDNPPSRQKGQTVAPTVVSGPPFSRTGNERVECEAIVAMSSGQAGAEIRSDGGAPTLTCLHEAPIVTQAAAQPVAVDVYNQSIDGQTAATLTEACGGSNTSGPKVMQPIPLNSMNCFRGPEADPSTGCGVGEQGEAMFTITKTHSHAVAQPISIQNVRPIEKIQNGKGWNDDGTAYTIDTHATQGVAHPMVLMDQGGSVMSVNTDGTVGTLRRETHGHEPAVLTPAMAVRRLTPVECERLQGFPDNYTAIPWRGKEAPDGPRYKALGNSMAVPVMRWIGGRINDVCS